MARIRLPGGESFEATPEENLLSAAQHANWLVRYGCRNGNCEACCATLLEGAVRQRDTPIDSADGPRQILLCLCRTERDLLIQLPGNPRHGSRDQARRSYARIQSITPEGGSWRLRLQLPAGRRPPVYPGQHLLLEIGDGLRAEIDTGASVERSLSALLPAPPPLSAGDGCHLLYPLGFAYLTAPPLPNVLIITCASRRLQSQLLHAELPKAVLLEAVGSPWTPPPLRGSPLVLACADSGEQAQQWFEALLGAGLRPLEFRSDFGICQPWRVMRQDDNDNRFEVESGLTEMAAQARVAALSAGGHRQLYWAEPLGAPDTDRGAPQ